MKGLENPAYLVGYVISNCAAILLLILAWKKPVTARIFFFILFAWASWINWATAIREPEVYMDYAELAFLQVYRNFITGWFSHNIIYVIGFIATCQGLIAVSMLLKGGIYKIGITGGIIFLLSISPLGVGSAFPTTILMSVGLIRLLRENGYYLWETKNHMQTSGTH
jgi:hypothetical protein